MIHKSLSQLLFSHLNLQLHGAQLHIRGGARLLGGGMPRQCTTREVLSPNPGNFISGIPSVVIKQTLRCISLHECPELSFMLQNAFRRCDRPKHLSRPIVPDAHDDFIHASMILAVPQDPDQEPGAL